MDKVENEDDFQREFIKLIRSNGGHASNIESGLTSPGVPDIDYHLEITNNIELKFVNGRHRRKNVIRSSQIKWFRDRISAGGMPLLSTYIIKESGERIVGVYSGNMITKLSELKHADEWAEVSGIFMQTGYAFGLLAVLKNPKLIYKNDV